MKSVKCPTSLGPGFTQGGDMPQALMLEEWKKVKVKIFQLAFWGQSSAGSHHDGVSRCPRTQAWAVAKLLRFSASKVGAHREALERLQETFTRGATSKTWLCHMGCHQVWGAFRALDACLRAPLKATTADSLSTKEANTVLRMASGAPPGWTKTDIFTRKWWTQES